jgi:membrane protein required for colicin V production
MQLLDLLILIPLVYGAVSGYKKGVIVELVAILAFVAAMIMGFKFLGLAMEIIAPYTGETIARRILPFIGFSAIFFPTIYLVNQLGYSIRRTIRYTFFGVFDSLAGGALGLFTWTFGTSVFFWLLSTIGIKIPEHRLEGTKVFPLIVPVAPRIITYAVEKLPAGGQLIQEWKSEYLD